MSYELNLFEIQKKKKNYFLITLYILGTLFTRQQYTKTAK